MGLEYLSSLSGLWFLSLTDLPGYWLTDTKLQGLHGISRLGQLFLGGPGSPIQTNITAAAVTGSVRPGADPENLQGGGGYD